MFELNIAQSCNDSSNECFFNSGFKKNINRNRLLGKEAYDNLARINCRH